MILNHSCHSGDLVTEKLVTVSIYEQPLRKRTRSSISVKGRGTVLFPSLQFLGPKRVAGTPHSLCRPHPGQTGEAHER